ncbi:MAG: hypothetical protein U1E13_00430 [Methylophilaceae bacterium]|nr:hypothetical protein [Methylophilaceae bacterium]
MHALIAQLGMVGTVLWAGVFLAILLGLFLWLRMERRSFSKQDKTGSWLWLRIWYLPILIITGFAVVLPSYAVSGMEALGYFYIALFTLGPLVWFGLHILVGKCLTPAFTRSESLALAMSGLGFIIAPALIISALQMPIFKLIHQLNEHSVTLAKVGPLPHVIGQQQRYQLGDKGTLNALSLSAPPSIVVTRIEAMIGGEWHNTQNSMHPYYCKQNQDIHLAWTDDAPPPRLRFYWSEANGERNQAEFLTDTQQLAAEEAIPFEVRWRDDGIDLPAPINRNIVQLGWRNSNGEIHYRTTSFLQRGETFENDCVMPGYQRVEWQTEGPITALSLAFHRRAPAEPLHCEIIRPE